MLQKLFSVLLKQIFENGMISVFLFVTGKESLIRKKLLGSIKDRNNENSWEIVL